ncbi:MULTISPECIES: hypothetical protein [Serratia]|uniref:hypothetical protein n=1 Tax=Serratia TaxID=613 RepID=UPI000939A9E2|nr:MULTISPECIES: hypothetical protein [Serratia]MBE0152798.1 hypothetical protein [Serratia fonticola]OKP23017.1 hypothetical protein BSQ40_25295 [Serratia fonticola]
MSKNDKITDQEITEKLTSDGISLDEYIIQETYSGDYELAARLTDGRYFNFFWEDEQFHQAALEFIKRRGAEIISWDDYVHKN